MRTFDQCRFKPRWTTWTSYGGALATTALAALLRWALDPLLGTAQPFATFYVAVMLVTLSQGWRPGIVAALLGFLIGDWFFIPPRGSFSMPTLDALAHTLIYFLVVAALIYSMHSNQRSARALTSANESLRESEERLRATFQKAAVGMVEVGAEGRVTNVNERLCHILGYRPEELVGKTVRDLTVPEDQARSDQLNAELREGRRERIDYEKRYLKQDGSCLWVHVTASAIRDAAGHLLRFIGTVEDISERKAAEVALREQAQLAQLRADVVQALQQSGATPSLLQSVAALLVERLDAAFVRVWTLDASGQVLELQASAGLYTHLEGAHSRVRVGQFKIGRIAQERRPLVSNQVLGDPNVPGQDWARREGLVAFAGMPLLLEGRLLGVVAFFARHTLTAAVVETFEAIAGTLAQALGRKQAEVALQGSKEELARANAQLERKVRERTAKLQETVAELEQFSYTITHDMRSPLRAMRGYGAILLEECGEDLAPEGCEYLRRITESAERMDRLITDALQYSGVVREHFELEPVDADALLRGIVESYPQFQSPQAHIRIEGHLPVVLGNKAAMTQCFSNLLGNAVKFVRPGQTPEVRVWSELVPRRGVQAQRLPEGQDGPAEVARRSARLWFEDQGVGIAKEYQERIWGMFQRLDKRYEGTGIGLALVRKAVERMGGRVGVESQPGQGSRFWIELQQLPGEQSCPQEFSHSE